MKKNINLNYFLVLTAAGALLLLSGCNILKHPTKTDNSANTQQDQAQSQDQNVKDFTFSLSRPIPKGGNDAFIKQIKERLASYGYPKAEVTLLDNNKFKVHFVVPANVIFMENDFINYVTKTPSFEIRVKADPKEVVLTEQEKKSIESYNKDALARAQQILATVLKEPDKFAELAKKYSEDPGSKNNGGLYTNVKRGQFVKEFDDVLFNKLKVGEIYPQVVETTYGYHIIKKEAQRGEGDKLVADTRHILIAKKRAQDILAAKQWKPTNITGLDVQGAKAAVMQDKKTYALIIQLDKAGTAKLKELSEKNQGKQIAIFIDGIGVATPTIKKPIENGQIVLAGIFNQQGVSNLAPRLSSGVVYAPIQYSPEDTKK